MPRPRPALVHFIGEAERNPEAAQMGWPASSTPSLEIRNSFPSFHPEGKKGYNSLN